MVTLLQEWGLALQSIGFLVGAALLGLLIHYVAFRVLARMLRRLPWEMFVRKALLRHSRKPFRLIFSVAAIHVFLPAIEAGLPEVAAGILRSVLYALFIVGLAWLLVAGTSVMEDVVAWRYDIEAADNLLARKVVTQTRILKRILLVVICILTLALILVRFEPFRELGAGILASAGIAGIVIGFAAQRTLSNLLAGFQIAITQPIRVDDVVIVEGEFGWIEEITLTYVVVRVWDQRRIVMPISHFIEQPFQNWTRTSSELLGTVFLYVDYTVPFEEIRAEHRRLVEASDRWDGRACALQVTDTNERTVELRCLQSASSAPRLFELRCEVREKLLAYLQANYPEALPKVRAEMQSADADESPPRELTPGPDRKG